MLKLLRSKFAPNLDIANKLVTTSGKSLAKAGQSDTYSIGMFISHKDVFKTDKWTKNLLGKLLMKVRQELVKFRIILHSNNSDCCLTVHVGHKYIMYIN